MELAAAADLRGKIEAMFAGEHINSTEDRAVLHVATRARREQVRAAAAGTPCSVHAAQPGAQDDVHAPDHSNAHARSTHLPRCSTLHCACTPPPLLARAAPGHH